MQVSDILSTEGGARDLLRDTKAPHRWSDPTLVSYVDGGHREIVKIRPDALYSAEIVTLTPETLPELKGISDALLIGLRWKQALIFYVCYRALSRDSEHAGNAVRAAKYQQDYLGALL